MSVDKFGRFSKRARLSVSSGAQGFKLTADGDYDVENKRIKNLENPVENHDAINKRYIDNQIDALENLITIQLEAMGTSIKNRIDSLQTSVDDTSKTTTNSFDDLTAVVNGVNDNLKKTLERLWTGLVYFVDDKLLPVLNELKILVEKPNMNITPPDEQAASDRRAT